jgi:UDP-N-acetylglucosamine 2-epimerase (non-hydrolysing)
MGRAHLLITDSGGIQEEATGVGKPVLILRDTTERPEGVHAGSARLVGADMADLLHWGTKLLTDDDAYSEMSTATSPYGTGYAAYEISEVLSSIARGSGPATERSDLDAEAFDDGDRNPRPGARHVA